MLSFKRLSAMIYRLMLSIIYIYKKHDYHLQCD